MATRIPVIAVVALLAGTLAVTPETHAQTTWYVDDDTPPGGDGTSWSTAFHYLQDALEVAASGDEIRVGAGTYTPGTARTHTFQLISGVSILGGYAGLADPNDPDARDFELYESVLSGDLNGNDDPNAPPDTFDPLRSDNGYHVVLGSFADETAVLDGFTISGGNANGYIPHDCGGGMHNSGGSPALINCKFLRNSAFFAGAIYTSSANPTLTNCIFIRNSANDRAGGMYIWGGSPTLIDCTFSGNSVGPETTFDSNVAGGGITSWGDPTLINCAFIGNSARVTRPDLEVFAEGGGMFSAGSPTVINCSFVGNLAHATGTGFRANASGAGLYNHGGDPTLANCTFSGNSAEAVLDGGVQAQARGGGMFSSTGDPTLANCTFNRNSATGPVGAGGGMCSRGGNSTLANCAFSANQASNGGGGMRSSYSNAVLINCTFCGNSALTGGGMSTAGLSPLLTNCTFSANSADNGGGMYVSDGGDATVANCILWRDTPDEIQTDPDSTSTVTHSCIQGGYDGIGNIDADPLFVDPDGPDDDPNTIEDNDYRLSAGSPSIDAADNTAVPADGLDLDGDGDTDEPIPFDLDGNPRFADDLGMPDSGNGTPPIVDMGAYEFQGQTCFGDLDGDDDIDLTDLGSLLSNYGTTSGAVYTDGDLDRDGDVDLTDLAALLSVYGTSCP